MGLIYPFFTTTDVTQIVHRGGCAAERIFGSAADVGIKAVFLFDDPFNSGLQRFLWSRCRNCSMFSGVAVDAVCASVGAHVGPWTPILVNYVTQGNATFPPIPDVTVTLVRPDQSEWESVAVPVTHAFQVIFSIWALVNVVLASLILRFQAAASPRRGLAIASLSAELICNVWRFTFLAVDPWLLNSIYPSTYFAVIGGFLFGISCVGTWLIACTWVQLGFVWKHGRRYKESSRPLIIVLAAVGSVIILVMDFLPRILSIYGDILPYAQALPIFFYTQFSLHVSLGFFFLVTGLRVLWMKSGGGQGLTVEFDAQALHIARFIIIDSIFLFAVAGFSAINYAEQIFEMDYWLASNLVLVFLYSCLSTSQILVFRSSQGLLKPAKSWIATRKRSSDHVSNSMAVAAVRTPSEGRDSSSPARLEELSEQWESSEMKI